MFFSVQKHFSGLPLWIDLWRIKISKEYSYVITGHAYYFNLPDCVIICISFKIFPLYYKIR